MPAQPVPPRAGNAAGRESRQLLLRTAERLFAELGIDAVSLRQITAVSGMRNSGAVAYHFGDKAALIRAIIDDRMVRIEERARLLIDELDRTSAARDLRAVTEAAIRPAVEALGESGYFYRFLAQLDRHPDITSDLQDSDAFQSSRRLITRVLDADAARRQLSPALVTQRSQFVRHVVWGALADLEAEAGGAVDEAMIANLIDCVVAIYSAPASEQAVKASADGAPATPRARSARPPLERRAEVTAQPSA